MDNLFELIIFIIFIVISMIGSIAKEKKKKQQQQSRSGPAQKRQPSHETGTIFDEVNYRKKEKPSYYGEKYREHEAETWFPEESYRDVERTYETKPLSVPAPAEDLTPKIQSEPVTLSKDVEIITAKKEIEDTLKSIQFIDKLRNPKNLQEYILISEILGKPKALRR